MVKQYFIHPKGYFPNDSTKAQTVYRWVQIASSVTLQLFPRGHDELNTCEEGADQQCVVDSVNAASLYFQSLFEP